jgi:phage/plasmid-like protein (TIGR03299 family)
MTSVYDYLPAINANTAEEMAKQTGLDFTAIKADLSYKFDEATTEVEFSEDPFIRLQQIQDAIKNKKEREMMIPDKVAIIREDDGRYLGTVGRGRGLLQYRDVLAFTEGLVAQNKAAYVSGGVIGAGEQAFVVMKTNKTIQLSGTDEIDCYFYVLTSHDSSKKLNIVFAPLRKINGTILTGFDGTRIGFKHTLNVEARVKRAALNIDKVNNYFEAMEDSFRLLRSVRPTGAQLDTFFQSLFPDPEDRTKQAETVRNDIFAVYTHGPACQLPATQGTMLGAYFAVVEWIEKQRTVKKSKKRPNEYDAHLYSMLEGTGAAEKANAYAFALDLVNKLGAVKLFGSPTI